MWFGIVNGFELFGVGRWYGFELMCYVLLFFEEVF